MGDFTKILGADLIPLLDSLTQVGLKVVTWFQNLSPIVQGLIAYGTLFGTGLAIIIAGFAGIALALPAITAGLTLLGTVIGGITALVAAWAIPVALMIGAAVLLYEAWAKNLGGIQDDFKILVENISAAWKWLMNTLAPVFQAIATAGQLAPKVIADAWNSFVNSVAGSITWFINAVESAVNLLNKLPKVHIDTSGFEAAKAAVDNMAKSAVITQGDVQNAFSSIANGIGSAGSFVMQSLNSMGAGFSKLGTMAGAAMAGIGAGYSEMGKDAAGAANAAQKADDERYNQNLKNKQKIIASFTDMKIKIAEQLQALSDTHDQAMKTLGDQIDTVKTKISDLTTTYNNDIGKMRSDLKQKLGDMQSTLDSDVLKIRLKFTQDTSDTTADTKKQTAEAYVKEQQEAADLEKQVAAATTFDQKQQLQKQLDDKKATLATDAQYVVGLDAEVKEAKRVSGLTEIQQIQEQGAQKLAELQKQRDADIANAQADFAAKRALAVRDEAESEAARTKSYLAEKSKDMAELQDKQQQLADEIKLYDSKERAIIAMRNEAVQIYAKQIGDMVLATDRSVNAMINRYNALNTAIQSVGKSKSLTSLQGSSNVNIADLGHISSLSPLNNPIVDLSKIPQLATGGIVTGPTLAMIGEGGRPEVVQPLDENMMGGNHYHFHDSIISSVEAAKGIFDIALRGVRPNVGI